ncbi:hypothetical protein IJ118_02375 [Candidatus Saccharibacteria bacterium]|nr:hypothetical protein [Candidatus Saccharibacteria bacterium]
MMKRLFTTLILLAILGGLGFWGYTAVVNHQININHWFVGGMTRGVDLSSYQGEVDMARLAEQNVSFAYIKATEGGSYRDTKFAANWRAAEEANLPSGAYHFFSYGVSGVEQAMNYIETVGDLTGRLVPVVDMELSRDEKKSPPEKSEVVASLKSFLAVIEEEYQVKPLIYATKEYYEKYLKDDFSAYPRWVRSVLWPVYIEAGDDWVVWQYDDHGKLDGYKGEEEYIDLNVVKNLDTLRMK